MKPLLIMVGADKGGVGKTTISRTLVDYLRAGDFKFRAFDTEHPIGVLKRFVPEDSEIVDLTDVQSQMKVFDTLATHPVTLIDVRAGLLSPALKALGDIGLLEMVRSGAVTLVVMHVLGPSMASLQEIESTASIISGATHFLIKNHINNTEFFSWDPALYEKTFGASRSGIIDIPQLAEMATESVEAAGVSFSEFISNQRRDGTPGTYSMTLRGYTRTWLKTVFAQYDKANINGIVGAAVTS